MNTLNRSKYLKGKELKKVTELNDMMRNAESMDKLAWIIIGLCIVAFIFLGGL